jgi:hypothetical protein
MATTDPDREILIDAPNGKPCEERFRRAIEALGKGYSFSIAAAHAGIHRETLRRWLTWGAEGKSPEFTDFLHRCESARATFEATRVDIVKKAGDDGEWTAAAWWLERFEPEQYGKRQVMRHEKVELPKVWTVEIEGAVDPAELPDQDRLRELPPPREPEEIEVKAANG